MRSVWRLIIPVTVLFASCEKAIHFAPKHENSRLVVDATIEDGHYPVIYLTTSLDFFSRISLLDLSRSFVHNATITLSDGEASQVLKEYQQGIDSGYSIFYYSADTTGGQMPFHGKPGVTYSMTISSDDQEYTAATTIPLLTKKISTLYYQTGVDKDDSTKVSLFGRIDDPPGLGNYIRYFTKLNSGQFLPGLASVYDDQVVDGKTYDAQIEQGVDRNQDIDFEDYAFFHKGDTVTVKFCDIDKATYDFWRTMEYAYSSIGNPFSSPTRVQGNISNGALGYFGGYAVQYSSIIISQ